VSNNRLYFVVLKSTNVAPHYAAVWRSFACLWFPTR